jgi:hypothetical protein
MRKLRIVKACILAISMLLIVAGTVYADINVTPNPGPDGLMWDGTNNTYTWGFCIEATAGETLPPVQLDIIMNEDPDGGGESYALVNPIDCTIETPSTPCSSGVYYECVMNSTWNSGSITWTLSAAGLPRLVDSTNTGPNAVTFFGFNGSSVFALGLVLPLAVLGGVVYTKRKRQ